MRRHRSVTRQGNGFVRFFTQWSVKKVILTILVVGVLAGGTVFAVRAVADKKAVSAMASGGVRTTVLHAGNITESVTVTGTVESTGLTNVTSTANYKVTEILVQEGDAVTAGQTLAKLDTTDLQKQITKAQESLTEGITSAQKNYNDALSTYNDAVDQATKQETTLNTAKTALDTAYACFVPAQNSVAQYQQAYDVAYCAEQEAGTALNNDSYLLSLAAEMKTKGDIFNSTATDNPNYATAQQEYQAAVTNYDAAYNILKQKYEDAALVLQNATLNLDTAKANSNYDTLQRNYASAQTTYDTARKMLDTLESTVKNAKKSVDSATDSLTKAKKSDTLDDLREQLEDCTITATTGGTITAVNCTVGSAPGAASATASSGGTAMFVIQDTSHLKVAVSVDEYDIKNVAAGQSAVIKSDATGDTEIPGVVSQVSLTATTAQSSTSFGAEITVNSADSGLLIGMNAQGNSVVYVKQQDGTFEPVTVTKGMETDYYVEISGTGIAEGVEIRSTADETAIDTVMSEQAQQNGMAMTMGGGAAPAQAAGGPQGGDRPSASQGGGQG